MIKKLIREFYHQFVDFKPLRQNAQDSALRITSYYKDLNADIESCVHQLIGDMGADHSFTVLFFNPNTSSISIESVIRNLGESDTDNILLIIDRKTIENGRHGFDCTALQGNIEEYGGFDTYGGLVFGNLGTY